MSGAPFDDFERRGRRAYLRERGPDDDYYSPPYGPRPRPYDEPRGPPREWRLPRGRGREGRGGPLPPRQAFRPYPRFGPREYMPPPPGYWDDYYYNDVRSPGRRPRGRGKQKAPSRNAPEERQAANASPGKRRRRGGRNRRRNRGRDDVKGRRTNQSSQNDKKARRKRGKGARDSGVDVTDYLMSELEVKVLQAKDAECKKEDAEALEDTKKVAVPDEYKSLSFWKAEVDMDLQDLSDED